MSKYICNCHEGHIFRKTCSLPAQCSGYLYHIGRYLEGISSETIRDACKRIAVCDNKTVEDAVASYEKGKEAAKRTDLHCMCHICDDDCCNYAAARRQERGEGAMVFLFMPLSVYGIIKCGDNTELRSLRCVLETLRADEDVYAPPKGFTLPPMDRTIMYGVEPPPHPEHLRAVEVAFRTDGQRHMFDILLVDPKTQWCAVQVFDDALCMWFPVPVDERDIRVSNNKSLDGSELTSFFYSYIGYVGFVNTYYGRPYTLATEQQILGTLEAVRGYYTDAPKHKGVTLLAELEKVKGASANRDSRSANASAAHEKHLRIVQRELEDILRTPRSCVIGLPQRSISIPNSIDMMVRLLHDRGEQAGAKRKRKRDEEDGKKFRSLSIAAERAAREGAPSAGFDMYNNERPLW